MRYIFIHRLGQGPSSWDSTVFSMGGEDPVLCPGLHLLLGAQEASYPKLYRAFSDYCDGISGALALCGLSLGAILALNYAVDRPEKVRSLVLIGAQYRMPKALIKVQNMIFRLMPNSSFVKLGFQKGDLIRLTNSMADMDFSQSLKEITCSALILCGEKDKANQKAARDLAEHIPNARLQLVEGAGHEVNMKSPEKLAAALKTFYQERQG